MTFDRPSPEAFSRVFESKEGADILEYLIRLFVKDPVFEGGIDGIRKSDFRAGSRAPIEYIAKQINKAHGVDTDAPPEEKEEHGQD